jgi:hypothetical protein
MQSAGTENRPFPMENVAIFLATNQHCDKSAALCAGIHSNVSKNTDRTSALSISYHER